MFMKRASLIVALLAFSLYFAQNVIAQECQDDQVETKSSVPILTEFHDVIYQVWHTAWPEKDVKMLAGLLPDIEHYTDSLSNVTLPGILREKSQAWKENVAKLQEIVAEYKKASSPIEDQKLLDAAEQLHAQYEKLVRTIRPVMKEIDEFHQVLYMIYHHYLPQKQEEKLVAAVKDLKARMAVLEKAKLPERLKKKESSFEEARAALAASVAAIDESMVEKDFTLFQANMEKLHSNYQSLEKVFE